MHTPHEKNMTNEERRHVYETEQKFRDAQQSDFIDLLERIKEFIISTLKVAAKIVKFVAILAVIVGAIIFVGIALHVFMV